MNGNILGELDHTSVYKLDSAILFSLSIFIDSISEILVHLCKYMETEILKAISIS